MINLGTHTTHTTQEVMLIDRLMQIVRLDNKGCGRALVIIQLETIPLGAQTMIVVVSVVLIPMLLNP
jgi:hypothetical protein